MKEQKNKFVLWVKAHKKQLILTGVSITVITGVIFCMKNKNNLAPLWRHLQEKTGKESGNIDSFAGESNVIDTIDDSFVDLDGDLFLMNPINVKLHLRNLPDGYHHSEKKAMEATLMNIDLMPNQTIVDPYIKNVA